MMEFDRSKDTLRALQSKNEIALEDALGIFIDMCEDIKGSGISIENLNIENMDMLLTNLSRSGRIFLKIMKKKAEAIERVDMGGRVKKQEDQIEAYSRELEEKEQQIDAFEKRVGSQITALESRKSAYENRVAILDDKRQYLLRLEEDCQKLQNLVDQLENISAKSLEEKRASLQEALDLGKKKVEDLEAHVEQAECDLQSLNNRADGLKILHQEKLQEYEQASKNVYQMEQEIMAQSERIRQLSEKEKDKKGTVEELKQRQNRLNADVVLLQNEIDRLREHLANSDFDKLKIEKEKLLKEKMVLDAALAEETQEYDRVKLAMVECQEERIAQKESFEKEQSRILDENMHLQDRINDLSMRIENETKERCVLEKTLEDAQIRYQQLRKWFETLDMSQYEARIKNAQQRIAMFEDAQRALFYELDDLNMIQSVSNQEANEKREELRLQLKQIEILLEDYRKKYKMICELLSD